MNARSDLSPPPPRARPGTHLRALFTTCLATQISGRPYTAFRWQPGSEARYKETIVAAEVAIAKNVCQVCLMDMEYNLPVAVRDKLTGAGGSDRGAGGVQMPTSDVNKEWYWQNQKQAMEEGTLQGFQEQQSDGSKSIGQSFEKLAALSRNQSANPYYDRNLPKLCSFWVRQSCTRAPNHSCPYRPCNGTFRFPELASTHPELLSSLVRKLHQVHRPYIDLCRVTRLSLSVALSPV